MDWMQLWEIVSKPDNVPIVLLILLVPFYTWYGFRQARANDRLIADLEGLDAKARKGHHRKTAEWREGWDQRVHVWPYLLRIEFLAAIIVMAILTVWAITLDAPLEEPANPTRTGEDVVPTERIRGIEARHRHVVHETRRRTFEHGRCRTGGAP